MLIKAVSLSRNLLLNRSTSILSSSRTFLTKSTILKTKTDLIYDSSKSIENQIHKSCCYFQDQTNKTPQKPAFSPELQEILNSSQKKQQASESSSEEQPSDNKEDPKEEEEKKGIAKAFSREHGWKTSLALFGGIFVGASIYTLFSWGAPNLDENGKPVI